MEQRQIKVQKRSLTGTGAMRRFRKEGLVPAVMYAGGEESTQLLVGNHDLLMAVRGCHATQIFTFESDDAELNGSQAFIKDVQTEPIKDRVLHVDFLEIKAGRTIAIEVPIELVGMTTEVKQGLAILEQRSYGLRIECFPKDIPEVLQVDVSELMPGQSILASQIKLPKDTLLKSSKNTAVAAVTATRAASVVIAEDTATPAAAEADAEPTEGN